MCVRRYPLGRNQLSDGSSHRSSRGAEEIDATHATPSPVGARSDDVDSFDTLDLGDSRDHEAGPTTRLDDVCEDVDALFFGEASFEDTDPARILTFYHRDGAVTVPLLENEPLTVGRGQAMDVTIPDRSLSRAHARFHLSEGQLWVEDLGSTNGTRVNDRGIKKHALGVGDEVMLGNITAFARSMEVDEAIRLESHDRLLLMLDYELARARYFGAEEVSLAMLRVPVGKRPRLGGWVPRVLAAMRPVDRAALYGPNILELLLPCCMSDEAHHFARRCTELGAEFGLVAGIATYPAGGTSADQLIERSRLALQQAGPNGNVVVAASSVAAQSAAPHSKAIAESSGMKAVHEMAMRIARSDLTVLVTGETGTGKEVIARWIHERSNRHDKPFIVVDCAGIPKDLVEATLFGHERGAFTGATEQRKGLFELAEGGTLFLDELGELSFDLQPKLLRVLDSREIRRVGSGETIPVDVRVIAATNRRLATMVREGTFREDLHYRLGDDPIRIPPLRDRPEDIGPLTELFAAQASESSRPFEVEPAALDLLMRYDWPGNVRELRNVVDRGVVLAHENKLAVRDLPARIRSIDPASEDAEEFDFKSRVIRFETELIEGALKRTGGNQKRAAVLLKIPLRTLVFKIKNFGIRIPR
jgi:DNA-binding NtrC family response regulator/pSer/pThr/pTyr-binding forkhead associated (FHA) protein